MIEAGAGELVVARRPNENAERQYKAYDFLPCEFCLGFFLKHSLWHHASKCTLKPVNTQPAANYVRNSKFILAPFVCLETGEKGLLRKIFNGMKETTANPGMPLLCKNDPLIVEFARSFLGRLGTEEEQRLKDVDTIRTKVRTVGRLLKHLHQEQPSPKQLSDFITGPDFDPVIDGVKALAKETDSPQIALQLGHYLKQIALLKVSVAIQTEKTNDKEEARSFQYLFEAHWNNRVSCVARRRQRLRLLNKPALIPLTSDLVMLKDWLIKEMQTCLKNDSSDDLKWMVQLTMVRILIFNKRRVSEVEEMKVSDFLNRMDNVDNEEILAALDISERLLAQR